MVVSSSEQAKVLAAAAPRPDYEMQLSRLYLRQAEVRNDGYLHAHSRNRATAPSFVGG